MSRAVSPSTSALRGSACYGLGHIPSHGVSPSPMRRAAPPGAGVAHWDRCRTRRWSRRFARSLTASPFHGEGYRKIWARLRFAGIRTSKRRVLRLTREHGLQAPQRAGRPHGPKAHDGTIRTERVDEMRVPRISTLTSTGEGQAAIFVTVDHASTECLGIHAARRATRFEALEPLRQGVRACFGAFAQGIAGALKLRHDHGSQFVADDYQRELAFLGIESSPAFEREGGGEGGGGKERGGERGQGAVGSQRDESRVSHSRRLRLRHFGPLISG